MPKVPNSSWTCGHQGFGLTIEFCNQNNTGLKKFLQAFGITLVGAVNSGNFLPQAADSVIIFIGTVIADAHNNLSLQLQDFWGFYLMAGWSVGHTSKALLWTR
ncbi:MAG: hypothetical protein OXD01_00015, partial [Gammaproteobacteria bacterium]|nr:hypothetical protein [Gammaproteobacteria bacterium]